MTALLTAAAVTKEFGAHAVLTEINLSVGAGELCAVTGLQGSGRTVLLRCLSGVYRPTSGMIRFALGGESVDLARAETRTLAWVQRQQIASFDGSLAASPSQDAAAAVARSARVDRHTAIAALERLGFAALAAVPLGRLRPDARRSVALAAALQTECALLVLDDPESAAEPQRIADWVNEHRGAGTAVIAATSTHGPLTATASATAVLYEGKLEWNRQ